MRASPHKMYGTPKKKTIWRMAPFSPCIRAAVDSIYLTTNPKNNHYPYEQARISLWRALDIDVQSRPSCTLKSGSPPIRPPLAPPSAPLMPHLPGYPECRARRSGAPPLLRNAPRRAPEVPLPAAPRHVRRNRGAVRHVLCMGNGLRKCFGP